MTIIYKQKGCETTEVSGFKISRLLISTALICPMLWATSAMAKNDDEENHAPRYCSDTAEIQFSGCKNEIKDNAFSAKAICINISDGQQRKQCLVEASTALKEGSNLCGAQLKARKQLCNSIGEARYDPDLNPAKFDQDFMHLTQQTAIDHWESATIGSMRAVAKSLILMCSIRPNSSMA